jgi:hypothetical protein
MNGRISRSTAKSEQIFFDSLLNHVATQTNYILVNFQSSRESLQWRPTIVSVKDEYSGGVETTNFMQLLDLTDSTFL